VVAPEADAPLPLDGVLLVDPPDDEPLDDDPPDDDPPDDDPPDDDPLSLDLAAGLSEADAVADLSEEDAAASPPLSDLASAAAGFVDEYRSLYQPPPLSWKAVREIRRSRPPPQASHVVLSGSDIRCWYSNSLPQALH
jgi:hypothetical protein